MNVKTAALKLMKRAEKVKREHLANTFVNIGYLNTLVENFENQIIFGRRGTGKTHLFNYQLDRYQQQDAPAVYLDLRTIGSNGGLYSDSTISLTQRSTRLIIDVLVAIHDEIMQLVTDYDTLYDLSKVCPPLDSFCESIMEVGILGDVKKVTENLAETRNTDSLQLKAGASQKGLDLGFSHSTSNSEKTSEKHNQEQVGTKINRIHFGRVGAALRNLVDSLPGKRLVVFLDEWAEIPLALQPYLADMIKRCVLPYQNIVIKIAAIDNRCRFSVKDPDFGTIGFEEGSDITSPIHLDEYLVFENNSGNAESFFGDLLFRHIKEIFIEADTTPPKDQQEVLDSLFARATSFSEFVKASEGIPRDAINILGLAVQQSRNEQISMDIVRSSARSWYNRSKASVIKSEPNAVPFLNWIIQEIIGGRKARAFLVETSIKSHLLDYLYDERILHIIKENISGSDQPGKRYIAYAIDFGCYVDLLRTKMNPTGLLEEGDCGEVPTTDYRSIRRAILDPNKFNQSVFAETV